MSEDDMIRRGDALQVLREAIGLSDAADDIREIAAQASMHKAFECKNCHGAELVCENHRDKAWPAECECGAGAPCPLCRWDDATAGVIGSALWPEELMAEAAKRAKATPAT